MADVELLRLIPDEELAGRGPDVLAHVCQHLSKTDPRRTVLQERLTGATKELRPVDRHLAVRALRAAHSSSESEYSRARSFRNMLLLDSLFLALVAGDLALAGARRPYALNLCFTPEGDRVCPIGIEPSAADVAVLELVGLVAAMVVAGPSVRKIQGTSTPYGVPLAITLLKLPVGALTAVIGILLIRGNFIPGLSDLDSSGQIIAWAALFGAAQETMTRLVDDKAQSVLRV